MSAIHSNRVKKKEIKWWLVLMGCSWDRNGFLFENFEQSGCKIFAKPIWAFILFDKTQLRMFVFLFLFKIHLSLLFSATTLDDGAEIDCSSNFPFGFLVLVGWFVCASLSLFSSSWCTKTLCFWVPLSFWFFTTYLSTYLPTYLLTTH